MALDLPIETAKPEDAGEVLTVQRAAFLAEGEAYGTFRLPPLTETLDEIRAAIDDPDTVVLVARRAHRLVGAVRGTVVAGTGHIARLAVAPDLQGQGIARRLMAALERALAGRVTRFELFTGSTSEATLRLYHSLGYVDLDRRPASEITPALAYLEKRV